MLLCNIVINLYERTREYLVTYTGHCAQRWSGVGVGLRRELVANVDTNMYPAYD